MTVWQKVCIPIKLKKHVTSKVEKLFEDIDGRDTVDNLRILVSGEDVQQLLSVPKLLSGNAEATAVAM